MLVAQASILGLATFGTLIAALRHVVDAATKPSPRDRLDRRARELNHVKYFNHN
jgi:hypothetical protein